MKFIAFIFFLTVFSSLAFAQDKKLRVYVDTKQFYAPTLGHLLEVNLQFSGPSLNYIGEYMEGNDGLIADVAVFLTLEQNGKVIQKDAHRLESPFMKDSIIEDFFDLKRFVVDTGDYDLLIEIQDLHSKGAPIKGFMPLHIRNYAGKTSISNIQIVESAVQGDETNLFHKSGYVIIPRISNYFSNDLHFLPYYIEIYNSKLLSSSDFGIKQTIIDMESGEEIEDYTQYFRYKADEVIPVLKNIDISKLITGKYQLTVSVLAKDLSVVSSENYVFERTNDLDINFDLSSSAVLDPAFENSIPLDSAKYYLGSVIPIAPPGSVRDILSVLKREDNSAALSMLQSFWKATSGSKAYESWSKYKEQVDLVNDMYNSAFLNGYETDRGRVYLQYGSPTNILRNESSPSEYPYEIWQYNKIGRFSNKRFIFYNTDLIGKNYRLLHSDMIGEIKNENWPKALNSRNSTNGDVDNGNGGVEQHYGRSSTNLYRQY